MNINTIMAGVGVMFALFLAIILAVVILNRQDSTEAKTLQTLEIGGTYRVHIRTDLQKVALYDSPNGSLVVDSGLLTRHDYRESLKLNHFDAIILLDTLTSEWVKIAKDKADSYQAGWVKIDVLTFVPMAPIYYNGQSNDNTIVTSKGYSTDPNYEPTVTPSGKYHTIDGKAKQRQFQGSKEQRDQLDEMDRRGW